MIWQFPINKKATPKLACLITYITVITEAKTLHSDYQTGAYWTPQIIWDDGVNVGLSGVEFCNIFNILHYLTPFYVGQLRHFMTFCNPSLGLRK